MRKGRGGRTLAAWAILLILSAVPAIYLNTLFGYLPVLTLGIAGLLSLGYAAILRSALVLEGMDAVSSCVRGEEAELRLSVHNRAPLLCPKVEAVFALAGMSGAVEERTAVSFPLAPGEARQFPLTARFNHVGVCRAGLEEAWVFGLFGLFPLRIKAGVYCPVEVSPRIHVLHGLPLSDMARKEQQRAQVRSSAESMDYSGVREYAFGDPMKTIHWKLSAHTAGYLTKQMESYGNSGLSVLLDLKSPAYPEDVMPDVYDCLCETAVSLCAAAKEAGMDYELLAYDRRGEAIRWTPGDLTSYSETLGDLPPISTGGPDILELLRAEGRSLYGQTNLAVCTARLTEDLAQVLLELQQRGRAPLLFFALPDILDDEAARTALRPRRSLEEAGIPCCVLPGADCLDRGWM